jgi:hypothetical protein
MAKKIKLEVTEAQLNAIISITDDISAMTGCNGEVHGDQTWTKNVRLVDRMLINNGFKRQYK